MFSLLGQPCDAWPTVCRYAIGAQVAFPDRQVVAFVGDGGFTMLMGEIRHAR